MKHGFLSMVLCFALLTMPCAAQEIPLSTMSTDELISLLVDVQEELSARMNQQSLSVGPGQYIAGESIYPGSYEILCVREDGPLTSIIVFSSDSPQRQELYYNLQVSVGGRTTVTLKEGNILELSHGEFVITPFERSWSP